MNLSSLFIKRPVATILLMLGMFFFGIIGYTSLPVNDMPNIEFPYIVVFATMPGADPETMATSVAKPLEEQFATIAGIKNMTSSSKQGSTSVFLEFDYDRNIDSAALDVQAAISIAYRSMPSTMTSPPLFMKINPDSMPIINISLVSDAMTTQQLTEYADTYIAQRLAMINGVAQTSISGEKRYAVRIQLDPDRMTALSIGVDDITNAVGSANVVLPTGVLQGESRIRNIQALGQLKNAEEFGNIIISWRNDAPIRLKDVADVVDDVEQRDQRAWVDEREGIIVSVVRQPGGNTVEMVDRVLAMLPEIEESLPPSITMEILYDSSQFIRDSVHEVQFTLWLTVGLVVMVIFLFLGDLRATIIPSLALPFSIVSTFAVMYALGFTLNNVSLMALTLVVGFVVDDAIVMLENIIRHRDMGKSPYEAAMDGAKEIGFTIISMTVSLAAVFIPLLFMTGMVGKMFYEFAATIIIAVLLSGIISISLTPMLCNEFLTGAHGHSKPIKFLAWFEWGFSKIAKGYGSSVKWAVHHKFFMLMLSFLLIIGTGYIATQVPTSFFPDMDGSMISISTKAEESISFEAMAKAQQEIHEVLLNDPAIKTFVSSVGGGSFNTDSNTGTITAILHPISERGHINNVITRLREQLNQTPNLQVFVSNGTATGGGGGGGGQYSYVLVSSDAELLYQAAVDAEDALKQLTNVRDVSSDLQLKNPVMELSVNRDLATSLGISLMQIENTLYSAFGSRQVSVIYTDISDYKVIMEVKPELQKNNAVLTTLHIKALNGKLIPLDSLVTIEQKAGPLVVNHKGQFPTVTMSFNLAEGQSMGSVLPIVEETIRNAVPAEVNVSASGQALEFQESISSMITLIVVALVLIYLILGILYESFIHPLTILSGLPSAAFGALFSLWIFGQELNMMGFIGIIMLIGIVKKNAIMMLDFALEAERNHNLSPDEAIIEGCIVRFRPIIMTTLAAIMGALPLAIGLGETGADLRRPLGVTVAGGLIFSQIVTLYITPVYYVYFDKLSHFLWNHMTPKGRIEYKAKKQKAKELAAV